MQGCKGLPNLALLRTSRPPPPGQTEPVMSLDLHPLLFLLNPVPPCGFQGPLIILLVLIYLISEPASWEPWPSQSLFLYKILLLGVSVLTPAPHRQK